MNNKFNMCVHYYVLLTKSASLFFFKRFFVIKISLIFSPLKTESLNDRNFRVCEIKKKFRSYMKNRINLFKNTIGRNQINSKVYQ